MNKTLDGCGVFWQVRVDSARGIRHAMFSYNGEFIVAAGDGQLHIWDSSKQSLGKFITSVNIHSVGGFPITVDSQRNFVATGSTLSTAVKVWDLDSIFTCGGAQLQVRSTPAFSPPPPPFSSQ